MAPVPTVLPELDAPYKLSSDARRDFERDGHVLLRRVAVPAEAAAYRPLIREATFGNTVEKRALADRDTYGKAFIQVGDIWKKDPAVAGFTLAPRLARIAADAGRHCSAAVPRPGLVQGAGWRSNSVARGQPAHPSGSGDS